MSLTSQLLNLLLKFPKPTTPNPVIKRDVKIPMPDGIVLLADLYTPRGESKNRPF